LPAAYSQDKLITRKGDTIVCEIIQISLTNIYFRQIEDSFIRHSKMRSKLSTKELVLDDQRPLSGEDLNKMIYIDRTVKTHGIALLL